MDDSEWVLEYKFEELFVTVVIWGTWVTWESLHEVKWRWDEKLYLLYIFIYM